MVIYGSRARSNPEDALEKATRNGIVRRLELKNSNDTLGIIAMHWRERIPEAEQKLNEAERKLESRKSARWHCEERVTSYATALGDLDKRIGALGSERNTLGEKAGAASEEERKRIEERSKKIDDVLNGYVTGSGRKVKGLVERQQNTHAKVDEWKKKLEKTTAEVGMAGTQESMARETLKRVKKIADTCDTLMDLPGRVSTEAAMVQAAEELNKMGRGFAIDRQDAFKKEAMDELLADKKLMISGRHTLKRLFRMDHSIVATQDRLVSRIEKYEERVGEAVSQDPILRFAYGAGSVVGLTMDRTFSSIMRKLDKIDADKIAVTMNDQLVAYFKYQWLNEALDQVGGGGSLAKVANYLTGLTPGGTDPKAQKVAPVPAGASKAAGTTETPGSGSVFAGDAKDAGEAVKVTPVGEKFRDSLKATTQKINALEHDDRHDNKKLRAINAEILGVLAELKVAAKMDVFGQGEIADLNSLAVSMSNAVAEKAKVLDIKYETKAVDEKHTRVVEKHIKELIGKNEAEIEDAIRANYSENISVVTDAYQFNGREADFAAGYALYLERQKALYYAVRRRGSYGQNTETEDKSNIFNPSGDDGASPIGYA